jgi:hypothetical protein
MVGSMLNFMYWVRGEGYADMAAISARSVKKCYPEARVIVYTDGAYDSLRNPVIDEVLLVPAFNETPAMLANLQSQVHYCLSDNFSAPTVFLDADVLVTRRTNVFESKDYWSKRDLVVTQRDHVGYDDEGQKVVGVARNMPYNYGVLLVNNSAGGKEAMIWLRDRVTRFGSTYQGWYGNQWALRELVGGSYLDRTPRLVERNTGFWTIRVQVISCDTHNFTPRTTEDDLKDVCFLHAKGDRDELFNHYAEIYA